MTVRKRGIRLKELDADDPALLELLDTVLGAGPGAAAPPERPARAGRQPSAPADPRRVALMVREELESALGLLEEGLSAAGADRRP